MAALVNLTILRLSANKLTGPIPSGFINLTQLLIGGLSLQNNGLFTNAPFLDVFLDVRSDHNWSFSQTIAPVNAHLTEVTQGSATVEWDIIEHIGNVGRYHLWYSQSPGPPWNTDGGVTDSKLDTSHVLTMIRPDVRAYWVIVRSETDAWKSNDNDVISDPSQNCSKLILRSAFDPSGLSQGSASIPVFRLPSRCGRIVHCNI